MGKKRIIEKTKEEILAEREKIERAMKKEVPLKVSRKVTEGKIYISTSYNNTMISLTSLKGDVLTWTSAGALGFKGTRKSTPFAASRVGKVLAERAGRLGIRKVEVLVKGIGSGRESALRALAGGDLEITSIKDITPIPHNGCRPPKVRRT